MSQIFSFGPFLALAASLAVCFPAPLRAQTQPSQPHTSTSIEIAALALPEAPEPQTAVPITPQAAPAGSSSSSAQTPSPAEATPPATDAPAPTAAEVKQKQHEEAEREIQTQEKQRLLGVMPQFQVVMGGQAAPLSPGEKWRLALHSAVDPFYIGWAFVIGGGYGELADSDSQRGYGWGASGYFKRVGSNYADNVNGAIIGNALLPSILHQDPRYFRKGTGSIKSRFVYAALSTVICHGDNGKNQFNASNVLGNFISGAISNAYYPADQRGLGLTFENGADVTLFGALGGQLLEFGPDIVALLHRRHHAPAAPSTPAPASASPTVTP